MSAMPSSSSPAVAVLRDRLRCGKSGCSCRSGANCHCPGPQHKRGDEKPSLTVHPGRAQPVVVNCKAGCDQMVVIGLLKMQGLWPEAPEREPLRLKVKGDPVIEVYDYPDEEYRLEFQVLRTASKQFIQRRPNPKRPNPSRPPDVHRYDDWLNGRGNTRSLLYLLPELLAADPFDIVWKCNGEKAANRLFELGLVATCPSGGEGGGVDAYVDPLKGRRVVILEDHDEAGEKSARRWRDGLDGHAAEVAILSLPGLGPKEDVYDWLARGETAERLVELGEQVLAEAALRVTPTEAEAPAAMPLFPVDVLPPRLRALVVAGAAALRVAPDFIAVPLLAAVGAAIGDAWEIELKAGYVEGPNLYTGIIGDPGSKKTPALKIALAAIQALQRKLTARYLEALAFYEQDHAAWEALPKDEKRQLAEPTVPAYPHVLTTDATTEALAVLHQGNKSILLIREELSGFTMAMDQYKGGGKGADRQHFLSMWSRTPIKIDRKSQPMPIIVDRPCLSLVGGIQPDVLPEMLSRENHDDGLVDRVLWCYPTQEVGDWDDAGVDTAIQRDVAALFETMYAETLETVDGTLTPCLASLSREARVVWRDWFNANAAEMRDESFPTAMKGVWSKLDGQLARLTLILHVSWALDRGRTPSREIGPEILEPAIQLVEFFKAHAKAAIGSIRLSRSKLDRRILTALGDGPLSSRELFAKLGGHVKVDRLKVALEALAEDGEISVETRPSANPKGGRPTLIYSLVESRSRQNREPIPLFGRGK